MRFRLFLIFLLLLKIELTMAAAKIIYGYVEKATLVDKNLSLSSKLDTGAKSASLSAIGIEEFERNGKTFLRFLVATKQMNVPFEAEYLGKVKIKPRVGEHSPIVTKISPIKRPVVLLKIKMGDEIREIPVNLTNRKRFNYPLLLGRDAIIAFNGLVDPDRAFIIKQKK